MPSPTNTEEEGIVDAPGNDGNASMPEQVKRPNPCRKTMMMITNNKENNKLLYCIVLTARTAALSFFQNPAHDRESNWHAILIRI